MRWSQFMPKNSGLRSQLLSLSLLFFSTVCLSREDFFWQQWTKQGEAEFSYLFWDIYSSSLRFQSEEVVPEKPLSEQNLALVIRYQRDIKGEKLVEATKDQWEQQNYTHDQLDRWLEQLSSIYPDVTEGDSLAFVVLDKRGYFYFKPVHSPDWVKIGQSFSPAFSDAFLSIWLGEKTEYPAQRQQLFGEK
ncbi:chalcone isomerase family protein [Vibrio salinus]|uniref:chalcone isomerase family protein n=1 Tax=Vibrio salinus TaxID=2899784 RepID=UPI001E3F6BD8|nr:chalcone isomerase family protein [Vibrio salinus]MCE0496243.1 chalcone isomerase family protein [Vibrio salinus]